MCGICGFSSFSARSERGTILNMTKVLSHRGPDEQGIVWDNNFALGHTRLAIIDIKKGHQPMSSQSKDIWVSFNGEVYNFKEIRECLRKKKYKFSSDSDTEVIISAYREFGLDFVKKLDGMFAIALWDKKEKRLALARDRLGIKPLFYSIAGEEIVFASEIKAILKHPFVKKELNPLAVSSYLSYRYPLGKETFFKNIFSLEPGHLLTFQRGRLKKIKYWDLPIVKKSQKKTIITMSEVEDKLKEAVKKMLTADVPIGVLLSGGLDSSLLVALISKNINQRIKTYSVAFKEKEKEFDESYYANLVSRKFMTNHKKVIISPEDYFSQIVPLIKVKDAPLSVPNEVAFSLLSREMKKEVSVVLSAEGADELFGGYGRIFRSSYSWQRLNSPLPRFLKRILFRSLYEKYGQDFNRPLDLFLFNYQWFSEKEKKEIINDKFYELFQNNSYPDEIFETEFEKVKNLESGSQYLYLFQKIHLLGLLGRLDTATMAWGIEARVPYTDHCLVELVMQIPFSKKIKWHNFWAKTRSFFLTEDLISERYDIPKYILKEIAKSRLPKQIVSRRKIPFPVPLDNWLAGRYKNWAKEILVGGQTKIINQKIIKSWIDNPKRKDFGKKIWMLANLELWFKEYF